MITDGRTIKLSFLVTTRLQRDFSTILEMLIFSCLRIYFIICFTVLKNQLETDPGSKNMSTDKLLNCMVISAIIASCISCLVIV